jgi:hypothetical protein
MPISLIDAGKGGVAVNERCGQLTTLDETQQLLWEEYRHLEPKRHSLHQDANG